MNNNWRRKSILEKGKRRHFMKHVLLLLVICGTTPFLSGCWDRIEITDLAIVTAAAIDKKGNNQIELSVQVFIPSSISSGGGQGGSSQGGSGVTTMVRNEKGSNISDALSKLQSKLPRKVFWGHCKVFVFGEKLAKEGIQEQLDFLLRHPQPREKANVYVSKGEAKPILESLPPLENYSGEVLRELSDLHIGMLVTMQDLDEMLTGRPQAAALPIVKILPPAKGQTKLQGIPYIVGTAVFKKDKMTGTMTEKETRGLLWLRDEVESYTVTFQPKGVKGKISLSPVSAKVKIIPQIINDKWKLLVKISTDGAVIQNGTNLNLSNPKSLKAAERAYQKDIENRIRMAFLHIQHKKSDILGLGKDFYRKYPKQFNKVDNHWDEIFAEMEVEVDVVAHIRRQGYINKPAGLSENEVKDK
ncbi:Ger(x)C family spore germination protein [Peribacillus frigoritolerans]|uniref:Ger(x)C family spore germination protein n=2 Tax=Peribacillus frigoritolerans TaxID=450367 RepID=UPI002E23D58F|nr:Ger(x)C family spore germination protein [Peribacillus frigoritolerans]MED3845653.1 Ger(x)C family spore germination protein [Peribacillus frigoritolerans]